MLNRQEKIAIIFDHITRPETTGLYCLRALQELADVTHFHPEQLANSDFASFDLVLHIDDGLRYRLPTFKCRSAYWAIDTHLDFDWALQRSQLFDFVFTAQRDGADQLQQAGIENAQWLPLACDPEIHGRKKVAAQYDLSFVGNSFPGERDKLLKLLSEKYPHSYFGQADYREMSTIYSGAKIVFNRSLKNDINMRVFETIASGALLITNDLSENGLSTLFQNKKHLVTYRDADELIKVIDHYLKHAEERKHIASAGYTEVLAHHTYRNRMQEILNTVEGMSDKSPTSKSLVSQRVLSPDSAARPFKSRSYFEFSRPEVQALVPLSAKRILDIGCGTGRLGEGLKERQKCHVTGIELDETAANQTKKRLDKVVIQNVADVDFHFPENQFDCIVCADILEHLREPGDLLKKIRSWLSSDGSLVISIPNVRHHSVITSLLAGNWTYESAGLLDDDHVRFFTRREMEKLLFRTGFNVDQIQSVCGPGDEDRKQSGDVRQLNISGLQVTAKTEAEANEFFTYQYLLRAVPAKRREDKLTSIIVVTHNQLSYTHQCVESIQLRTGEPYELIFIDNGSTDGTPEYLQSIAGATVILNEENRGFPAAVNQGIEAAQGDNVLLLNNDTIVTTGWLRHMLDALESDKTIGLVGPCSNNISGPQQVPVDYLQLNELDGFAWDRGNALSGSVTDLDRLVGFCMLIKREVIEQIGRFDEQFGMGNFEDDDFCRRAQAVGFRTVVAEASFIHHFASVTFKATGVNFSKLMQENQQKYENKWATQNTTPNQDHCSRLSLCMIVRDNERTIHDALSSIKPWVDEMIVVDTGSRDRTPEIAGELGAQVFHFPWCDDFSAARNKSLKHATGDWLFWMDSDDTISEEQGCKLRELIDRSHQENILGYVMQVHCPTNSANGQHQDMTVVDHIKLFRNRPDLQFEHRIHEQIIPAIRRANGDVAWTDIFVTHSGSDQTEQGQQRKLERDFRLLHLDLDDRPDHPFVLFNLGMTYADANQYETAIRHLERCLEVSSPQESHVRKAYALLVSSLQRLSRHSDGEKICQHGLGFYPDDPELLFRSAMLHHHFGRLDEAETAYRSILDHNSDRHFSSTDQGIFGFKTYHNLAVVLADKKRWREAASVWEQITQEEPNFIPAWRGLAEMYQHLKDEKGMLKLMNALNQHPQINQEDVLDGPLSAATHSTA
ncbi:glycosyltransferase [Gimesia aquarii]|uniref:SPBc2 prophage-derived glycosyltransferase SunS n=1 Tax=Gimesia aquarii TaxID=2527964 RepID=A0A517WX40_9PLAN|nr:glycosyltransferase [Gimesia aquarii]QDU09835.1 SPBc2 prophage-derived glycosyltransferase SunS [Gimesia aquarii]